MPTCPNCGNIVMNGDPYCPHCGTTFKRIEDEMDSSGGGSSQYSEMRFIDEPMEMFYSRLGGLHEPSHILVGLRQRIDVSKATSNTTFTLRQSFPGGNIEISFKRENKYFSTTDYIRYSCIMNKIEGHSFINNFYNLKNSQWFKDAVLKKESETGLEFFDCGGGYDASWDWDRTNIFELKEGCEVIAHFIEDEYYYRGFVVDFKNHRLENDSKRYERASPYDLVKDFDWY